MKVIRLMRGLVKYIVLMAIFCIIQVYCELELPNVMSDIVDIGIANNDTVYISNLVIRMLIITIICFAANVLVIYSTSKFSNKYGYNIREALYNKISGFSKKEIDEFGASTLITRSTNNVSNITSTFSFGLRLIIFAPIMGIGAAIMAYSKAPTLAPVVIISVSILMLLVVIIFASISPKFEVLQKYLDKLNATSREILSGIKVIKAFNKKNYFKKRFDKVNSDNRKMNVFLNKILYLIQPMMILIINVATIIIVYISTRYLSIGTLEIGSMMAFIQYLATVLTSFLMLLVIILNIPRVMVSFKRINEVLNVEVAVVNDGKIKLNSLESIEFRNVYFKYENANDDMLKNISFKIIKGEKAGIIGSSGCGKTTIINLLLRHIEPTSGEILINGIDIHEYDIKSLRNIFAYTPQNNSLFKGTVKENLSFDKKINVDNLDEALSNAQIKDFVLTNEEGYNYELFQSGVNLSGGQKQRMSIARALLSGGECLLLDDSLSSVDYITDKRIRESIYKLYKDKMIILVTQRVSNLSGFDKIIVIESGKIEMVGNYLDVVNSSKVFNEFIESQKREVSK